MPVEDPSIAQTESFDLRTYIDVLVRRWRVIAIVALVALVLALGLSFKQDKKYHVEADLLLSRSTVTLPASSSSQIYADTLNASRQLANDVKSLESGSTRDAVAAKYDGNLDPDDVTVSFEGSSSDLVTLGLTATDSVEAARLVNLYVEVFIELRRQDRIDELADTGNQIQAQITEVQDKINSIRQPLTEVEQQLAANPGDRDLVNRRNDLTTALNAQLTPLQTQLAGYQSALESVRFNTGIQATDAPKLITQAEPSTEVVSPKPVQNGILALVIGLLLGTVLAFLRDALDERIRGLNDLDRSAPGAPVLAGVPESRGETPESFVAVRDDPKSMTAEAFRTLRTSVKFAALDEPIRVLQVTSPLPGEGKTTAVANLAESFAQGGERVAIVCCDLRRPKIQRRFGQGLGPGFTDVLLNEVSLADGLRRVTDNLYILPAGSPPPNPSELLSSSRASAVIAALAAEFDLVLIDSTPVLPVADALVVSRLVDATLVVVDARTTKRRFLRQTMQRLGQVNAPVRGLVLNGIGAGNDYTYGYAYGYGEETTAGTSTPGRG